MALKNAPVDAEAADALDAYNAKRRFDRTREPRGRRSVRKASTRKMYRFVVQQHDATSMHYDFRLELDGVLLSWAVPKGPSLSPQVKRLAVQTEDHPVSYRNFEGEIPHGEYGGGTVIVWDRGRWTPEGDPHESLRRGHLSFTLDGEKLQGRFTLLRTGKQRSGTKSSWLLFKRSDEHARSGAQAEITVAQPNSVISGVPIAPRQRRAARKTATRPTSSRRAAPTAMPPLAELKPQLATLVDRPPTGTQWVYEIKLDGYRMMARIAQGKVELRSRNGLDWSHSFPAIAAALGELDVDEAVLDGELCYVGSDGLSDFQSLQNALPRGGGKPDATAQRRIVYYVFDLLWIDGEDVRGLPLLDRKQHLRKRVGARKRGPLQFSAHVQTDGGPALLQACKAGFEGLIAKRADAPYRHGRGTEWLKLKCHRRQEFVVVGMTPAQGTRVGFGALLLALRDGDGWHYVGKVGTGFDARSLRKLQRLLKARAIDTAPVVNPPRLRGVRWCRPELVCEIEFSEMTRDGSLRHPSFQGLREDKPATDVRRERATPLARAVKTGAGRGAPRGEDVSVAGVAISHPDRIIDTVSGVTKGELARYHEAVAEPFARLALHRPLAIVRCPQGDAQACFFQKHRMPGLSAAVRHKRIAGNEVIYADSPRGLMELVQFNAIEFHAWGAPAEAPKHPDWMVFDLDPDPALDFSAVIDAASEVREALGHIGLHSFVKTTGGKGLHVVVPLQPTAGWDAVKDFSRAVAETLAAAHPDRYVATMSKAKRTGKIFIDYLRNGEGATAVLPYSPRARPGATVAWPVGWKDLRHLSPATFTVRSVPALLKRRRRDPWAAFEAQAQPLPDPRGPVARSSRRRRKP